MWAYIFVVGVYFRLATIFPVVAIGIRSGSGFPALARAGLGAVAVIAALFLLAHTRRFIVLPFAALTLPFAWRDIASSANRPNRAAIWMLGGGTIVTAWTVAAGLEWLTPLAPWLGGRTPYATSAHVGSELQPGHQSAETLGPSSFHHLPSAALMR